ncbi:MAG: hypothetical protein OEV44_05735 [Spirochaetota bacterium]|nr:hypothetical protein [Spirochaetota bacterium]
MVRSFNTNKEKLSELLVDVLEDEGYEITHKKYYKNDNFVYFKFQVKPAKSKDIGYISSLWELELLKGGVFVIDGKNYVVLQYLRGSSHSKTHFDLGKTKASGYESLPEPEELKDRKYYKNIMALIAEEINE